MRAIRRCLIGAIFLAVGSPRPLGAARAENVIYIFDATGSMAETIGSKPKLSVAKKVMGDLMEDMAPPGRMGLVVIGDQNRGCDNVPIAVPMAASNAGRIKQHIDQLIPKGTTPLAEAIRQTGQYVEEQNLDATIVLVTDGEEQCGGDPFAAASSLHERGVKIILHVVGFAVSESVQRQLKRIAVLGGGTFYEANDSEGLRDAVRQASRARPKYLRLSSFPGKTSYSKVLHKIREGEALEIRFRPVGPVQEKGSHFFEFVVGRSPVSIHANPEGWALKVKQDREVLTKKWPAKLKLEEGEWNNCQIIKAGGMCEVYVNDVLLFSFEDAKPYTSVKAGVNGYGMDIGGLSYHFDPF